MPINIDPEKRETQALFELCPDWSGKSVLEIGSGNGRLTWRYAGRAARVITIEPDEKAYALAMENCPRQMEHVEMLNLGFDQFILQNKERFDLALLSWSL